jgi:hypothetical protein
MFRTQSTFRTRRIVALLAAGALIGACSDDSSSGDTTVTGAPETTVSTTAATTSVPATTIAPTTTTAATTSTPTTSAATTVPAEQPVAVWPAADVVFDTPEAAAADFVSQVFGDGPALGAFVAGDQRSGEIEVFATESGNQIGSARSTLLLRQLGPSDGWFVLAAASDVETVTTPAAMATVPAAPLVVEGVGTGFEATIVVSAFIAGHADNELDRVVTMAGNFGEVAPYSVTLDLTGATPGEVVVLLVNGGTGLETDPGDFGAIAVVVG